MKRAYDGAAEKSWHVIYVRTRYEKRAHDDLGRGGIESFLPMRKELHQWSDRKKWVEVPLFRSYVFVNITASERNRVYMLDGFVNFVAMNGKPSIVPEWQIDIVKRVVDYFPGEVNALGAGYVGKTGVIVSGPLAGLKGKIVDVLNERWFTIKIDGLEKLLAVKVPISIVQDVDGFPSVGGPGNSV